LLAHAELRVEARRPDFAISRCLAVCVGTQVAIRQKNEPSATGENIVASA